MNHHLLSILKISGIAAFAAFLASFFIYPGDGREWVMLVAVAIGFLSGFTCVILLFRKSWRREYFYIPFSCGLSSVIVFLIFLWPGIHIKRDKQTVAVRYAKEFFRESGRSSLQILSIDPDSSQTHFTITAWDATKDNHYLNGLQTANNLAICEVSSYGKWNENGWLSYSVNVIDSPFNDKQITILRRGMLKDDMTRLTDQDLQDVTEQGWSRYFHFLRNILADSMLSVNIKYAYSSGDVVFDIENRSGMEIPDIRILAVPDGNYNKAITKSLSYTLNPGETQKNISQHFEFKSRCQTILIKCVPEIIMNDERFIDFLVQNQDQIEWDRYDGLNLYKISQKDYMKDTYAEFEAAVNEIVYYLQHMDTMSDDDILYKYPSEMMALVASQYLEKDELQKPISNYNALLSVAFRDNWYLLDLMGFQEQARPNNDSSDPKKSIPEVYDTEEYVAIKEGDSREWVDLGLSIKWATYNIGASSPSDLGNYFAWGETTPKTTYTQMNYKYGIHGKGNSGFVFSRYNKKDKITQLDSDDDAAIQNWGHGWRTPTREEFDELKEGCTWKWTSLDGAKGRLGTSKKNGNTIFLPASGYQNGDQLSGVGQEAYYWSSSLSSTPSRPWHMYIESQFYFATDASMDNRHWGASVRPVLSNE